MVKGAKGGYYIATRSEEAAERLVLAMNLDAYVRGDEIESGVWHDFTRNKVVCLHTDADVEAFLLRRSAIDFDKMADWVE